MLSEKQVMAILGYKSAVGFRDMVARESAFPKPDIAYNRAGKRWWRREKIAKWQQELTRRNSL